MKTRHLPSPVMLLVLAAAVSCAPPDSGRGDPLAGEFLRLLAAEDARPAGGPALATIIDATRAADPFLRSTAVRALGRLEDPDMVDPIAGLLADPEPAVRREAANAVAQAVHRGSGAGVSRILHRSLATEGSPAVRGALARSLGRLSLDGAERRRVGRSLVTLTRGENGADAPEPQLVGAMLGLESLTRAGADGLPSALGPRLSELTRYGLNHVPRSETPARIRLLALMSLARTAGMEAAVLERGLVDPAQDVRQVAASLLPSLAQDAQAPLIDLALSDDWFQARAEAVRHLGRSARTASSCARLVSAAESDPSTVVQLLALDALARPCPDPAAQLRVLQSVAEGLGSPATLDWHASSHALVAYAAVSPNAARAAVRRHAQHANAFVRAYAARAAARIGDIEVLAALADDPSPNVRTAALPGLAPTLGDRATTVLTGALGDADDPQLILTLTGLLGRLELDGSVAAAALGTLERISEARRETDRDARVALLDLVEATGDRRVADQVERYLRDFDGAVATRAAALLLAWTGQRWIDAPRLGERTPLPTADEMAAMERANVVLHMAGRGAIEIRLLPYEAPTNALRLWNLARTGVLDGLTLHRMAPNFVIQGGSPGANEYAGHGPFTRDEVGLPVQWRGTVGLSTRGRDTGDGQIYVNLIHNVRLDHDYTIMGVVTAGMDVVDRVLEGDTIERAEVRSNE